ncbi:MAG: ATP-dependent 6-phosphofructokinase [bacterium]|nr:ATP-dependent 6-phosphofructokinase [bacterium]
MRAGAGAIGVLTGGGDCPGLNAAIRAVTKTAITDYGMRVVGFRNGFEGLVEGEARMLSFNDVSGILTLGGTILGTTNRADPFRYRRRGAPAGAFEDLSGRALLNARRRGICALVCIGGDGTLAIAGRLGGKGLPCVGVPKTIDNDLPETEVSIGFHSAVTVVAEAIDRLHTTAESHHRVMVIEVMGRYAGWIALCGGVAGGGDVILLPEIPYRMDVVCDVVRRRFRRGRRFSIVVVAEGAHPKGGGMVVDRTVADSPDPVRLGGIGKAVAAGIEEGTGLEARVTVLGHLQRGGTPTPVDRLLATRLGEEAVRLAAAGRFNRMAAYRNGTVTSSPFNRVLGRIRKVPRRSPLIRAARSVGTSFGA